MSTSKAVAKRVMKTPLGKPFSSSQFLELGSNAAVYKTLSRLVSKGSIERVSSGVYVRPKKNRFIGSVKPEISSIVKVIAKSNGETIQTHGAEAARQFKLSTQVPTQPVYYTSGSTRTLPIGNMKVKFVHASKRKLQLAGKKSGMALSALWYMGKEGMARSTLEQVCNKLEENEFSELLAAEKPAWLSNALNHFSEERAIV